MEEILNKMVAHKKMEVAALKQEIRSGDVSTLVNKRRQYHSLKQVMDGSERMEVIAEFKRKSPSAASINQYANVSQIAASYQDVGAACISVLTDQQFFGGSAEDFREARAVCRLPMLRKEFIVDDYQVKESAAMGADVILLIAAILDRDQLRDFNHYAKELSLEVLVEIHNPNELEKLTFAPDFIGVNNRDLQNFKIDVSHSISLAPYLPMESIKVSESGIQHPDQALQLREAGYRLLLMGEYFMKQTDPGHACYEFIQKINRV